MSPASRRAPPAARWQVRYAIQRAVANAEVHAALMGSAALLQGFAVTPAGQGRRHGVLP